MRHVDPERLQTKIRIADDNPVTLEFVMIDYVRHLLHHLEQIGIAIE
jgi:hypothetical protein